MTLENQRLFKTAALSFWAVGLVVSMAFMLASVPMLGLSKVMGRSSYWVMMATVSIVLGFVSGPFYGILSFSVALSIGLFNTFYRSGKATNLFYSGAAAVLTSALFVALSGWTWLLVKGENLLDLISLEFEKVKESGLVTVSENLDLATFKASLPSAFILLLVGSLFIALIFEKPLDRWLKVKTEAKDLKSYRVPEFLIWVFILSLLGTFLKTGSEDLRLVSLNFFAVTAVVYFFQGLAIVKHFFDVYKVPGIWRALWIALIIIQLHSFVTILGVVDFWADFRSRLDKKKAELSKINKI